jgi:integrase
MGVAVASIRKRTWKSGGEEKTAWIADYFDQGGKRHIKTFSTKKAADAWLITTRGEVQRGVHTPENAALRLPRPQSCGFKRVNWRSLSARPCDSTAIMSCCT